MQKRSKNEQERVPLSGAVAAKLPAMLNLNSYLKGRFLTKKRLFCS